MPVCAQRRKGLVPEGRVRGRAPPLFAGEPRAVVLAEVWIHKCRPETKRLRSHKEVDSERGLPRAALLRDQIHCIQIDHSMFLELSWRFLEGSIPIGAALRGSYFSGGVAPRHSLVGPFQPIPCRERFLKILRRPCGRLAVHPAQCVDVQGRTPDPMGWTYRIDVPTPSGLIAGTREAGEVFHVRYGEIAADSWRGRSPLTSSRRDLSALASLMAAIDSEAAKPTGTLG